MIANKSHSETTLPNQHRVYVDIPLFLLLLTLMSMSLMVLYSAGGAGKMSGQALRFGVGLFVMFSVLLIPRNVIRFFSPSFYALTLLLLVAVHFFGMNVNGSQRWLNLGVVQLQPSELAKLSIPLMLATYFYEKSLPPSWRDIAISLLIIFAPVAFVYLEPDLGTSILVASSGLFLLFLAGIYWRLIIASLCLVGVFIPIFWQHMMKPYQKERVMTFLNPESDPTGTGYNIIQSQIAIGSGGMHGRGYRQGLQSAEFLPERTTDFIFAVFSEEFGFIGVVLLLTLYALIVLRSFWLSVKMQDNFARLLSGAFACTFFVYFSINIGMVSGLLPVVGLPLPLFSYGGTSVLTIMFAFGIMMNLYGNRHQNIVT